VDRTALCYAVSHATTLFGASDLPDFDKIFIVSFTDGFDNGSSTSYGIPDALVYQEAEKDLKNLPGLKSYAIGLGADAAAHVNDTKTLVVGGGDYLAATSSSLNSTFEEIANSVLASSKNIVLRTQDGIFTEDYPKYFRLTVTPEGYSGSTIICKLVEKTLTVVTPGEYVAFDAPVTGTLDKEKNKIVIPLNNLKYVRDGSEHRIKSVKVEVSRDNITYYTDVEDASTSEDVAKTIGVVLVIDCSTSLGSDFPRVQSSANHFIDVLAGKDVGNGTGNGNNNGGDDLGEAIIGGITWATRNVGTKGTFVANPQDYGRFYTFEEAQVACPAGWRTPTHEEFVSLYSYADGSEWTTVNGINGYRFGSGANTIFMPAAGYSDTDGQVYDQGSYGGYWSSTASDSSYGGCNLGFSNSNVDPFHSHDYVTGFSVRCVGQ
jgi:uncharacterized protein (TIGR02145 family)